MPLSLLPKAKDNTNTNMGLLVVFFPEDNSAIADKTKLFPSPSSSSSSPSSSSRSPASSLRRTNSSFLISKTQSTILICALFLFITLLLFTLSTFEPSIPSSPNTLPHASRRFLSHKPQSIHIPNNPTSNSKTHNWFLQMWRPNSYEASKTHPFPSTALQRMGTLYRRGTRAMTDLLVGHVAEDTTDDELRLFLRLLHRSGLTAKADVVLVFPSPSSSSRFASIIQQENDSFSSLIDHYSEFNFTESSPKKQQAHSSNFDPARFFKTLKKETEMGEPLWGKKSRSNLETGKNESNSELTQLTYGSVLSFDATELDPENSLAGFLDHVPLRLRRWACYPMLLGRVRRNFKHVMLVDVKNVIVTNDPLGRVRNRIPESVLVYTKPESGSSSGNKHSKKNSDKTQSSTRRVNSDVIMGGARGVRRLSNAMLIEIVRAAMQHKKKNSVSESGVLSQLVSNEFMLKNVKLTVSSESIPEASSLGGRNSIIERGNSNRELNSVIKKQLCSSDVDSSVYREC